MGNDKKTVRTEIPNLKKSFTAMRSSPLDMILSPAYFALNYGKELFGMDLLQSQMDKSIDQFHSPTARHKMLQENVKGIKTSYLHEHFKKATQSITTHLVTNLTPATTGFESLLQPLEALVNDPVQGARATQKRDLLLPIQRSLDPSRRLNNDLNLFKLRMETLQQLLETNAVDNPRVIAAYIKEQYDKMVKELKLKKTADLTLVDTEMAELRRQNVGGALTEHEINTLTATLKKDIEESYDKAEKGLEKDFKTGAEPDKKNEADKGTPSLFSEFDKSVKQAEAELCNFVLFSEKSKSKTLLESEALNARLGAGGGDQGEKYRDVSFSDYANSTPERDHSWISPTAWYQYSQFLMNNKGELKTPSGLRINCEQEGVISFSFPPSSAFTMTPFYYYSQDRLLGADLMIMVQDMVKRGCTEITLVLECDNPALRKKIMEEFYYCAHLANFPDDKIKFKIGACTRAGKKEEQEPIDNKSASEIMGQLGRAPKRAQGKKAQWNQEQALLDKNANVNIQREVAALDEQINDILGQNQPTIDAQARFF